MQLGRNADERIKKAPSYTETVYRTLHADLVTCRIPPGTQLKAADLARRLGVSLAAVREALSRLSSESLVDAQPQRGFRAAPISATHLQDLTAARIEIESICMRQSVARFDTLADLRLEEAMEAMLATAIASPEGGQVATMGWVAAHAAFHEALVSGCGNAVLRRIRQQLFVQSERYRCLSMSLSRSVSDLERDHRLLVETVKRRDPDGACDAITRHIEATTRILLTSTADGRTVVPRP